MRIYETAWEAVGVVAGLFVIFVVIFNAKDVLKFFKISSM